MIEVFPTFGLPIKIILEAFSAVLEFYCVYGSIDEELLLLVFLVSRKSVAICPVFSEGRQQPIVLII